MKRHAPLAADPPPVRDAPARRGGRHALRERPGHPASPRAEKWRTRSPLRIGVFLLLIVAAAATGRAGRLFLESRTHAHMELLVVTALPVAVLWAVLTATAPPVVMLHGSVLTVKSRRGIDRFDLADGMQVVELQGEPRSRRWSLVLQRPDGSVVRLRRRNVDARKLDPRVRELRRLADRSRAERWSRLGL